MKKRLLLALCAAVLAAASFSSFLPSADDLSLYDNVIRLHVIANSDSDADQELKLRVRDRMLELTGSALDGADTKAEAEERMRSLLPELEAAAADVISEDGCGYDVKASLTVEEYPRKSYGTVTLPSGKYTSLRVIIGSGEGHNWWCVLFPRMCTRPASSPAKQEEEFTDAGFTPSQYRIITDSENVRYVVKFRIIEIIKSIFDK